MLALNNKTYDLLRMPVLNLDPELFDSFQKLPVDQFLNTNEPFQYRFRRYGSGSIKNLQVSWDEQQTCFLQNENLNNYAGGVNRNFPPLEEQTKKFIIKNIITPIMYEFLPKSDYTFGAHQIRIKANDQYMGRPAPEGIHQDGFDYVAVCCINANNVTGGDSILVDVNDYNKKLVDTELRAGEILIFNDKTFAHYASPIVPKCPGDAYRDVIVTTYTKQN